MTLQTTLLGLAIAFIIALVAALIGPYFIDWNQFRPQFEAEASRIVGTPVRVGGGLDARLLPTPALRLRTVTVGAASDPVRVSADKLDVEFSLGSLLRGEWRASELSLSGFALDLGLDRQGRFSGLSSAARVNLGSLTIDRMNVAGRISLHDAASGVTLRADDLVFGGDVRPQAGTMRGEGAFTWHGARIPFRLSSGQSADGKGTRVRFTADPGGRPLSADIEGVLTFDNAVPLLDGVLTLARPVEAKGVGDWQPWKVSSRVKATPSAATFEQMEAAYGPEDSALRLTGGGSMRFGASPLLQLALSARQFDADRLLGKAAADAEPLRMLPALRTVVASLPALPVPARFELGAEQVVLAGRPLQNIALDVSASDNAWTLGAFAMRAPGATQVAASGVVNLTETPAQFVGPVSIDSVDPDALIAWLQGRADAVYRSQKPLRLSGRATLAPDRIALDDMNAAGAGGVLQGRVALIGNADGPSRFEAALKAASLDLDALSAVAGALAGPPSAWPDAAQVSLEADRAVIAGQEVHPAALSVSYSPTTLSLDRLAIGDGRSGVSISGAGSFDRGSSRGKLTMTAAAPSLAQIGSVIAPFAPVLAQRLTAPGGEGMARLRLQADAAAAQDSINLHGVVDIDAPQVKGSVTLAASPPAAAIRAFDLAALGRAEVKAETRLAAQQTAALLALLGLDRVAAAANGPAWFESSLKGAWGTPLQVSAAVMGAGIDGNVSGTIDPAADPFAAKLNATLRRADLSPLFGLTTGTAAAGDVAFTSRVGIAGNVFTFDDLDGAVGASRVHGRLVLTRGEEAGVDGEIAMDTLDVAPVAAVAFGAAGRDPSAPLARGWLRGWRGRLAFEAARGVLPGGGELRPVRGAIRGDGQSLVLDGVRAGLGGGEVAIDLDARQSAQNDGAGTSFKARVQLSGVDGAALRYRGLAMPPGQVALQMTLAGQGRSASGLAGALSGAGTLTLSDARIAGLDPRAFEVALRAGNSGQPTDDIRLKDIVEPVLSAGAVTVASAQIPFAIRDGRLRVENVVLEAPRARIAIAGGYDLPADQMDLRAIMSPVTTKPLNGRPEIRIDLNGSPDRLSRTLDVAALSSWLAMRAIDRETRRLDQLEHGGAVPAPESDQLWDDPLPGAEPLPAPQVKVPARDPRRKAPAAKAPPRAPAPQASTPPARPADPPASGATLAPLPPPIDIRPAPGALRAPKPRAAVPPAATGAF
jgi:large subunit ribosomal protein L24